jgi:hypothetical protein
MTGLSRKNASYLVNVKLPLDDNYSHSSVKYFILKFMFYAKVDLAMK